MTHSTRTPSFPANLEDYAPWVATYGLTAPYGECQCGCGRKTSISEANNANRGYRKFHPMRFVVSHSKNVIGTPRSLTREQSNGTCEIALTQGQVATVDVADYKWLTQWEWHARRDRRKWYAGRSECLPNGKPVTVLMHREILGVGYDMQVDHKDGDGLNNTRGNLRPATDQQNRHNRSVYSNNTSGFKGVSWDKQSGKWKAQINADGKHKYIGLFDSVEGAAYAYDDAAREFHGEFARLNMEESSCR